MVRKITSPVTLQCNITVHDILKVSVVEEDPKNFMVWTCLTGVIFNTN